MEAEHQPVDHLARPPCRDPRRPPSATTAPATAAARSRRRRTPAAAPRRPSDRAPGPRPSDMLTVLTKLRSVPAPLPSRPPMKSISSAICGRAARGGALIEQRRGQHRQALLALRVLGRAGADQHAGAHHRLLVLADQHHLQAVGQRADLVGRELHRLGRRAAAAAARWASAARRPAAGRPVTHHRRHQHGDGDAASDDWTTWNARRLMGGSPRSSAARAAPRATRA